ncbi:hypothetical protein SAMN05192530_11427 [Aureimonas jatrophae]|uniref:Uncharacterized protein n=1 Tax=Aureimonas jatrophae TaxID=1166073 RepID=A0A1H0MK42_9HYPH|nr:hypothetical protein SAMN05192530_11427 [Aureimonas jatrophae]
MGVRSDLRMATVYEELDPVGEVRLVGGQERNGMGDLFGLAHSTEGNARSQLIQKTLLLGGVLADRRDEATFASANAVTEMAARTRVERPVRDPDGVLELRQPRRSAAYPFRSTSAGTLGLP